jgi:hypothetical protein
VPSSLTLAPGASGSFSVTLTRNGAALNTWAFGSLVWSDGVTEVRSPLSAKAVGFLAPATVSDTRASGSGAKVVSIVSAYTGSLSVIAAGLVPATVNSNTVPGGATQCYDVTVPAGALVARFQLFNTDTQGGGAGTDLDLDVYSGSGGVGTLVGSSGGGSSDELVTLSAPTAGVYSACVTGYATPAGGAAYKLSNWVVGPVVGAQTLRASAPASVVAGGAASIGLGWSVPAGKRYLGLLRYFDGSSIQIGASTVWVDNH